MESGELSAEPEMHLDSRGSGGAVDWEKQKQKKKKGKSDGTAQPEVDAELNDAFFGDDDEDGNSDDS